MDRWHRTRFRYRGKVLAEFLRRPKIAGKMAGFLIDFSDSFVLLHRLEWDSFTLNGFSVLREDDIQGQRFFSRRTHWQNRATSSLGLRPKLLKGIELKSWGTVLASAARRFSLLTIHMEIAKPDVCYIGVPLRIGAKTMVLDNLDYFAEWTGPRRIRLEHITRIDFGGGYEKALAAIAPKRKSLTSKNP